MVEKHFPEVFFKKKLAVLKNLAKFTGKHLCLNYFLSGRLLLVVLVAPFLVPLSAIVIKMLIHTSIMPQSY